MCTLVRVYNSRGAITVWIRPRLCAVGPFLMVHWYTCLLCWLSAIMVYYTCRGSLSNSLPLILRTYVPISPSCNEPMFSSRCMHSSTASRIPCRAHMRSSKLGCGRTCLGSMGNKRSKGWVRAYVSQRSVPNGAAVATEYKEV